MPHPDYYAEPEVADVLWRQGRRVLKGALIIGVGAVLGLAIWSPWAALAVPGSIVGGLALGKLIQHPRVHLALVLISFVVLFRYTEGINLDELVVTLFFLSYVGGWLIRAIYIDRIQIINDLPDLFLALFLAYVTLSFVLVPFFDGDYLRAASQWRSIMVLALYFPLKHYISVDSDFLRVVIYIFAFYVAFILIRNAWWYYSALHDSTALWQLITTRTRMNERILLLGMLGALAVWLCGRPDWLGRLLCFLVMSLGTAGLLLGQSRVMIGAIPVGIATILVLSPPRQRLRAIGVLAVGAATLALAAILLLGDLLPFFFAGISERAMSLGSAHSHDISLVNRFYEWRATWTHFLSSPIVGHGFGVPYSFYSLEFNHTEIKYFTHNTYLGLLYRHGVIGVAIFGSFALLSFISGIHSYKRNPHGLASAVTLGALAGLAALAVAAVTESTLLLVDGVFGYMYLLAVLAGLRQRKPSAAT